MAADNDRKLFRELGQRITVKREDVQRLKLELKDLTKERKVLKERLGVKQEESDMEEIDATDGN